jgi:acyl carrier protein
VIAVIRRQLHASDPKIDCLTRFVDDLGADSPGLVRWTHMFEETLDVEIPKEQADRIRTVETHPRRSIIKERQERAAVASAWVEVGRCGTPIRQNCATTR